MASKKRTVVIGEHICILTERSKVVPALGNWDGELIAIAQEYQEYRQEHWPWVAPLLGEWRWCLNPKRSRHAFYAEHDKINEGKGWFCSPQCSVEARQAWSIEFPGFCQEFKQSPIEKAAAWLLDTALTVLTRKSDSRQRLYHLRRLIRWEAGRVRVKEALKEIYRAPHVASQRIINEFLQTKEGAKLRSLIE